MRTLLISLLLAGAAHAETPMTGAEFDAYTQGRTLTFMENGTPYGIEQYRPGRQVRWAFFGDECRDGEWYEPEAGLICFVYEGEDDVPQCWNFFRSDKGLRALFANEPNGTELYEATQAPEPLICHGPGVGV